MGRPRIAGLLRDLILALETQFKALEQELLQRLQAQERPKRLGQLTLVALDGEVCDWARFHNRKQVGGDTGRHLALHAALQTPSALRRKEKPLKR